MIQEMSDMELVAWARCQANTDSCVNHKDVIHVLCDRLERKLPPKARPWSKVWQAFDKRRDHKEAT
jgi:hypothetical protein